MNKLTYEQWLTALCLWREARNQLPTCIRAVKAVIINRTRDPQRRWPNDPIAVILQPKQFSSFNAGTLQMFPNPSDQTTLDWTVWNLCQQIVLEPIPGQPDALMLNGINAYESVADTKERPAWAKNPEMEIGDIRFYKL
jgi:hypothetical protein